MKTYCLCGDYIIESHVVKKQDPSKCISCGALVGPGSIIIQSYTLYSHNGSYIRPDGIIVLDERDYDNYLNGSLIFSTYNATTSAI